MAVTQEAQNQRLHRQLMAFNSPFQNELAIRNKALETYDAIESLTKSLNEYTQSVVFEGEKLIQQKFVKSQLLSEEGSAKLHQTLSDYILSFPSSMHPGLCASLGLDPLLLQAREPIANELLRETPDGAVGSMLEYFETVILSNALEQLHQEVVQEGLVKVTGSRDSTFLQGFKDVYYVGEEVTFDFFSRDSVAPTIRINQIGLTPEYKGRHYKISWTPVNEGNYELTANIGQEYIRRSFKVVKPALRFLENEQEVAAFIGEVLTLTPDLSGLENIRDLNFTSNGAQMIRKGSTLTLIPLVEGRFTIEMRSGKTVLDRRSVFASKGQPPVVALKDMAGATTGILRAHCLESVNPRWQVINFHMTVISPTGARQHMTSQTRFLRNELRQLEREAPKGSTILFDQIRLLNENGITTTMGAPLFLTK